MHSMKTFALLTVISFSTVTTRVQAEQDASTLNVINWDSDEGIKRFERSQYKVDFFKLANQFESQSNRFFCGPTSVAIVLNALRLNNPKISKPRDATLWDPKFSKNLPAGFEPLFNRYTQNNVFIANTKTKSQVLGEPTRPKEKKSGDPGFQLRQLHALLVEIGVKAELRVANDALADAKIREEILKNLQTKDDFIIVNYTRSVLGQKGGGHISPLGAYDAESDSFLILDVNPNAASWVWAPVGTLLQAMRTFDTVENRGYVVTSEAPASH